MPGPISTGLAPFFEYLARRRRHARSQVVAGLQSDRFIEMLAWWRSFADGIDGEAGTESAEAGANPIGPLASRIIGKRYRRVMAAGKRIRPDSPDERLHGLRIECKKLRYLMEFFLSLFPLAQMKMLVKHLKRLQENLGEFNDLCVQQAVLTRFVTARPRDRACVLAVGVLLGRLYSRQQQVRAQFSQAFRAFSDAEVSACFKELFGSSKEKRP